MSTVNDEWLRRYLDGELTSEEERQVLHHIADDPEMRSLLKFDLLLRQDLASDFRTGQTEDTATDPVTAVTPTSEQADIREKISVPDTFFDGVMNAIFQKEAPYIIKDEYVPAGNAREDNQPIGSNIGRSNNDRVSVWNRFWQPRPVMWRPLWSAGIAATLLLLIVASPFIVTTHDEPDTPGDIPVRQIVEETTDRVMMRFVYIDNDAESVAVAGDFSDWEPITLTRQSINGDVAWTGTIPLPRGEHRYMFIKDGEQWATDPLANRFVEDGFGNKNAVVNL